MLEELLKWTLKWIKLQCKIFKRWTRKNPIQSLFGFFILFVHFSLIVYFFIDWTPTIKRKKQIQIHVRSVISTPPIVVKPAPTTRKKIEKTIAKAKPKPVKNTPLKKKNKPLEKNNWRHKSEALLQDIQKKLASVEYEKVELSNQIINSPDIIKTLNIDKKHSPIEEFSENEMIYEEEVVTRLQVFLRLPERGDVHLELSLKRDGSLNELTIKNSGSSRNTIYIQKKIPEIIFPNFGDYFKGENQHTFNITLTNRA